MGSQAMFHSLAIAIGDFSDKNMIAKKIIKKKIGTIISSRSKKLSQFFFGGERKKVSKEKIMGGWIIPT